MASLGELSVGIAASVEEAGFNKGVRAIESLEAAAQATSVGVAAAMGQMAAVVDKSAQRITDAAGRVRDGYGKFVPSATLAAEAAGNVGGSLGKLGDIAKGTAGTFNGQLVSSFAAFDKAIKPLNDGIGRLGEGLKSAGTGLTTYVTVPLAGLAVGALAAYGKIQQLQIGLQAVAQQQLQAAGVSSIQAIGLAATETAARLKLLEELAKAPGLGFSQAVQGDIRLRSVGLSAEQSAKAIKEFANAIATTGGGRAEFDRVTVQLGQLSAKGKVLAQDLRPIIEAAPAVAGALQRLYGTVDSEDISKALERQGKSSKDFVNILTDELAKLPRVGASFSDTFENFQESGVRSLAKIGEALNKAFNLGGVLDSLSDFVAGAAESFSKLDPSTQKLIFGLVAGAAAVGPLLVGFGAIVAAIPSVVAGLEVLGLASTAALGPIGIGVVAVAAAAALIINHWDELVAYFSTTGEGGQVFSNLAASVSDSVSVISDAFSQLSTSGDGSLGGLVAGTGVIKALFLDIAVGITSVSNVVGGFIGTVDKAFRKDFAGSLEEAKRATFGLIDPLAALFGYTVKTEQGFDGAAGGGGRFGTSLLQLSGVLTGFNTQLQGFAGGLPQYGAGLAAQSGLLETLRKRLEEVKDAREKETSAAAISVDNKIIAGLQAQIDKLLGVSKGAKQAEKDIKGLAESLMAFSVADVVKPLYVTPEFKLEGLLPKLKDNELPELIPKDYYKDIFTTAATDVTAGGGLLIDAVAGVGEQITKQQVFAQKAAEDFIAGLAPILEGGLEQIAFGVGDAVGKIIIGAGGLNDIGAAILGPLGDVAIKLGQLAIGVGIGIEAIDTALKSLNPAVALVAGVALVALGTAVKGAASSIATGGGGSSLASQPRTSYSSTIQANTQQPLTVRVVGTLSGRGADLIAVIREEDYRSQRTD